MYISYLLTNKGITKIEEETQEEFKEKLNMLINIKTAQKEEIIIFNSEGQTRLKRG